jgi:hypothetical protein
MRVLRLSMTVSNVVGTPVSPMGWLSSVSDWSDMSVTLFLT